MSVEPRIPYGIGPRGEEVDIEEADAGFRYFCPQCGQSLDQRRGYVYRHYFAHSQGATDFTCPWRNIAGLTQSALDVERQAIERASSNRIRIFLRKDSERNRVALLGLIPPLSTQDLADIRANSLTQAVKIESKGAKNGLTIDDMRPSVDTAWIELDPGASEYEVRITPESLSNGGTWRASAPRSGAIFIGNEDFAELVAQPKKINVGDYVFILSEMSSVNGLHSYSILRFARFFVIQVRADHDSFPFLQQHVPNLRWIDDNPLRVDVLLPIDANPQAELSGFVYVRHQSPVLLAITPPPKSDPELKLFPIPFRPDMAATIEKTGHGGTRFVKINFHDKSRQRILIHWPYHQDRDVVFDILASDNNSIPKPLPSITDFGITLQKGDYKLFLPITDSEAKNVELDGYLISMNGVEFTLPKLTLQGPEGIKVGLKAEFPITESTTSWAYEGETGKNEFQESFSDVFMRGAHRVQILFGTLGTIKLKCDYFFQKHIDELRLQRESRENQERHEREIRDGRRRAMELDQLKMNVEAMRRYRHERVIAVQFPVRSERIPKHISKKLAINMLKLPPDTSDDEVRIWRHLLSQRARQMRKVLSLATNHDNDKIQGQVDSNAEE